MSQIDPFQARSKRVASTSRGVEGHSSGRSTYPLGEMFHDAAKEQACAILGDWCS